jgi:hypothetical protein
MREEGGNAMKACLLLFLSLAIISCAPPYSAELNSSAGIAGQMTLIGTMGPVGSPDGNSTTAIKFLPIKPTAITTTLGQLSVQSGFLVSESSGQERLDFAFQGSGGNVQTQGSGGGFSLAGADPNYPLYEYDVIESTATLASILVFSPGNNTYQCFTAALPNGPFQAASSPPLPLSGLFVGSAVLGVQDFPLSATPYDKFSFLVSVGTSYYGDATATFGTSSFSSGSTTTTNVTLSGSPTHALYYQGPLGAPSYASYLTAGNWVCQQWTATTTSNPTPLTSVTRRIDAVLTNGDLISTQGGTLTVYDLNGTELNSVPLGGMQFCYEAYVGNTPYVFFSLSMGFPHQSWAFRVYAIPTSALQGLKG